MLKSITYKGPLVAETTVAGEQKSDGIVTNCAPIQLSRDRYMLFFGTRDTGVGTRCVASSNQLRGDAPDGPVLREGVVARSFSGWDPFDEGVSLRKAHGIPMAFGVRKGALRRGVPLPSQNVFAVKWCRFGMLEQDGRLINPFAGVQLHLWPAHLTRLALLRVEWMQFRLNDAEDDIEIVQQPRLLTQRGYDEAEEFCALGPGCHMNHAMAPPVPSDDTCTQWYECDTFAPDPAAEGYGHGQTAPVEYTWNHATDSTIDDPDLAARAMAAAGIHYLELQYHETCRPAWEFAN